MLARSTEPPACPLGRIGSKNPLMRCGHPDLAALEVWNEPNNMSFWVGSVQQYVDLVNIAAAYATGDGEPGADHRRRSLATRRPPRHMPAAPSANQRAQFPGEQLASARGSVVSQQGVPMIVSSTGMPQPASRPTTLSTRAT